MGDVHHTYLCFHLLWLRFAILRFSSLGMKPPELLDLQDLLYLLSLILFHLIFLAAFDFPSELKFQMSYI